MVPEAKTLKWFGGARRPVFLLLEGKGGGFSDVVRRA